MVLFATAVHGSHESDEKAVNKPAEEQDWKGTGHVLGTPSWSGLGEAKSS